VKYEDLYGAVDTVHCTVHCVHCNVQMVDWYWRRQVWLIVCGRVSYCTSVVVLKTRRWVNVIHRLSSTVACLMSSGLLLLADLLPHVIQVVDSPVCLCSLLMAWNFGVHQITTFPSPLLPLSSLRSRPLGVCGSTVSSPSRIRGRAWVESEFGAL